MELQDSQSNPTDRYPGWSARIPAWIRALRPTQWTKNILILLPALAAHVAFSWSVMSTLALGLLVFSMTASAVYLVNDIVDLPHDRRHPTKRLRPIAAGELSVPIAIVTAVVLLLVAAVLATALPLGFGLSVLGYFALTFAYSLTLKRRVLVDVVCLAALYTSRVFAGSFLLGTGLSDWFLAFFIFIFVSLALVKRLVEIRSTPLGPNDRLAGRGYMAADVPLLIGLGAATSVASTLVYCLYIASPGSDDLYRHPIFLWMAFPLLLYWQARMWLLTSRGVMDDDPVLFAVRDRTSYIVIGLIALLVWMAT